MTRNNLNDQLSWLLAHINSLTPNATVPALPPAREPSDTQSSPTDETVFFTPTAGLSPAPRPNESTTAELYPVLPREPSRPSASSHGATVSNGRLQENQQGAGAGGGGGGGGEGGTVVENMGRLASKPNTTRPNLLLRQEQLLSPASTTATAPISLESEYSASIARNAAKNRTATQNAQSALSESRAGSIIPPPGAIADIIDLTADSRRTSSISAAFGNETQLWREDFASRPEPITPSENSVAFGSTKMIWREDYASRSGPVSPDEESVAFGNDVMVWEEEAAWRPEPQASKRGKKRKSDQISQPPPIASIDDFQDIMDILSDDESLHVSPKRSPTKSPVRSKIKTSPSKSPSKLTAVPNTPSKQRTNLTYDASLIQTQHIKKSPSKTPKKNTVLDKLEVFEAKLDLMLSDSDSLFGSEVKHVSKQQAKASRRVKNDERIIQDSDDEPMTPPAHHETESLVLRTDSPTKRLPGSQRDHYTAVQDTPSRTRTQPLISSQTVTVARSPQKAHRQQQSQIKPVEFHGAIEVDKPVNAPHSSQISVHNDDEKLSAMVQLFLHQPSILEMKRVSLEEGLRQNRERFKMSLQEGSLEPREQLRRDKEKLIKQQLSLDLLAKEYRSYEDLVAKRDALIARIADAYEHDLNTDDDEAHLQELDGQLKTRQDSLKTYLSNADIKDPNEYETQSAHGPHTKRSESVVQATQAAQLTVPLTLSRESSQVTGMGSTQVIMQTQVPSRLGSHRPSFDPRPSETFNSQGNGSQHFASLSPRRAARGEEHWPMAPRDIRTAPPAPHQPSDPMDYEEDLFDVHDLPPRLDPPRATRSIHQSSASKNRRSPRKEAALQRKGYESDYSDDIDISELAQEIELQQSSSEARPPPSTRPVLSETSGNLGARKEKSAVRKRQNAMATPVLARQRRFPWYKDVKRALKDRFRMTGFRHNQLEAINATLAGKDAFILMPTGGGKSLCYQLPAVVTSGKTNGITVVVSPLLSLMQDQVEHLKALNIAAATFNGDTTPAAKKEIMDALKQPFPEHYFQLLYVTPEMINKSQAFLIGLGCLYRNKKLARLVIDEAHCVSQWGHDFRPDYKQLGSFRERFPEVPIMALTATATQNVIMDVKHNLGIDKCEQFTQSFNRPNLYYEVRRKEKDNTATIADLINSKYPGETGIVYTLSRKSAETIAKKLRDYGISSHHYHASVESQEKARIQRDWQQGKIKVVVATIAFGMGIDKPDVRFVIHQSVPKSLEGYYQETGRAGRDGEASECYLYFGYGDLTQLRKLINDGDGSEEQRERQRNMLNVVAAFCDNQSDCRRVEILRYFGETFNKAQCNANCDNCKSKDKFQQKDRTKYALAVLEIVRSAGRVTLAQCTDYLMGKKKKADYTVPEFYGIAKHMPKHEVHRIVDRLLAEEALKEENVFKATVKMAFQYFRIGRTAHSFLAGGRQLWLTTRVKSDGSLVGPPKTQQRLDTPAAPATRKGRTAQFTSTLVSSPARKSSAKKKGKAVANYDEESDDDFGSRSNGFVVDDGFSDDDFETMPAPVARRRRMNPNPVGPPISRDARLSEESLTEVQKDILESFFEDAKKMEEKVRASHGYRKPLFSQLQLREMGLRWTSTLDQMRRIPGIDEDMVTRHGNKLLPLIQRYRQQYQEIMGLSPEPRALPLLGEIVDLVTTDDDDEDDGDQDMEAIEDDDDDDDDDEEGGETSGYFEPSVTEKAFMESFHRANQQEASSSKSRGRNSGAGTGAGAGKGRGGRGGKGQYASRRSSGGKFPGVKKKGATSKRSTSGQAASRGRATATRGRSSRAQGVGFDGIGLMDH